MTPFLKLAPVSVLALCLACWCLAFGAAPACAQTSGADPPSDPAADSATDVATDAASPQDTVPASDLPQRAIPGEPDSVDQDVQRLFHGVDGQGKDGPMASASLDLIRLYVLDSLGVLDSLNVPGRPGSEGLPSTLPIRDGSVAVDILVGQPEDKSSAPGAAPLDSTMRARLGIRDLDRVRNLYSGYVPISSLALLASQPGVRTIRPASATLRSSPAPSSDPGSSEAGPSQEGSFQEDASQENSSQEGSSGNESPREDESRVSASPFLYIAGAVLIAALLGYLLLRSTRSNPASPT